MAIKPILFNSHMVRAILDGRKTVTRRVVKPQHLRVLDSPYHKEHPDVQDKVLLARLCEPPYSTGDALWVRETWAQVNGVYYYRADDRDNLGVFGGWCPSIHMPKEAARIFLRVKNVRVERLHEMQPLHFMQRLHFMQEEDVRREGFENPGNLIRLWDSTIKPADRGRYGWEANPWVWVIEFERCEKPEKCDDYGRSDDQGAIGV